MNRLDELANTYFEDSLDVPNLLEMIGAELQTITERKGLAGTKTSEQRAQRLMLALPKFTPSEAWGEPSSIARDEMVKFFSKIRGKSLQSKLNYVTRLYSAENRIRSTARIISTLVILESLASCITSFNSASAGFVFEGFLAALLDGTQVADKVAGTLPIEDIVAFTYGAADAETAVPMSLKLLTKKSSSIDGSYTNLINGLMRYETIKYVVVLKEKGEQRKMEFHEFTFTRENVEGLLLQGSGKNSNLLILTSPKSGRRLNLASSLRAIRSAASWEEKVALLQATAGYNPKYAPKIDEPETDVADQPVEQHEEPDEAYADVLKWMRRDSGAETTKTAKPRKPGRPRIKGEDLMDLLEEIKLYREPAGRDLLILEEGASKDVGSQWHFTQKMMTELPNYSSLGMLDVTPDSLKAVAVKYMDRLGDEVIQLFESVKELSENINRYFTYAKRDRALNSGNKAVANAQFIEQKTLENIRQEKGGTESG